jgi:crossover junction endodeoxyribonuclease RuvC
MIIIGIDPGTATTGFAIIDKTKDKIKVLDYGCVITTPNLCPGDRLKIINNELNKLIKKHQPKVMAIENLFFFKNLKTAMPVSQAKGVILLTAAKKRIPVYEFTPLQVKMAITGYGKAEKKQVQKMIQTLLNLEEKPKDKNKRKDDATDALGVAFCYTLQSKTKLS